MMLPSASFGDMGTTKTKIYINPNFRMNTSNQPEKLCSTLTTSHLNPLFLDCRNEHLLLSNTIKRIHMNPDFIKSELGETNTMRSSQMLFSNSIPSPASEGAAPVEHFVNSALSSDDSSNVNMRRIIRKSRTQLVREPANCKPEFKMLFSPKPQPVVLNKNKLIRKVTRIAAKRSLSAISENFKNVNVKFHLSKYKLINGQNEQTVADYGAHNVSPSKFHCHKPSTEGYKYRLTKSNPNKTLRKTNIFSYNKRLQMLNINGLLYKSTNNSLKLKDLQKNEAKVTSKSVDSQQNGSNELTIHIRGTKYVMDGNKLKLTRVGDVGSHVSPKIKIPVISSRIDIGGFTYVSNSSSKNVFIRTENHLARAYVTNIKYKCLQILSKHRVKTNTPCLIYQRLGKCVAHERKKCSKDHRPHMVNVCSRFLRGDCDDSNCLLSHNVSLSKMPVCKYYLQGICVRSKCPYLHKKLSNSAEICMDFLRGYCGLAEKCDKRHEFLCIEFDKCGKCTKRTCNYCKSRKKSESRMELKVKKSLFKACEEMKIDQPRENRRYFLDSTCNLKSMNNGAEHHFDNSNIATERTQLGTLPSYISLL